MSAQDIETEPTEAIKEAFLIWSLDAERDKFKEQRITK